MDDRYLVINLTLTKLTIFINENFVKKSGNKFRIADTQGYIKRGYLPTYLGGNSIQKNDDIPGVSLYNIEK